MTDEQTASTVDTVVLDVDGTLVDTNYQHALCWFAAFRSVDVTPALWRIHRAIGMGGDQLVTRVAGEEVERRHGDALRERWEEEFDRWIDSVQPFEQARDLVVELKERGLRVVLASSGKGRHVDHYLDLLDVRELADAWTTADDAEETKPAPDLVQTALAKGGVGSAVLIGDSVWDAESGARAGLPVVGLLTGGFGAAELLDAGVREVHESIAELREHLDDVLRA
jgi:HAD superfamily hydrolase (TIGR01549 family)